MNTSDSQSPEPVAVPPPAAGSGSDYEQRLAEWKRKQGLADTTPGEIGPEDLMVAEDAKRKGRDYCGECAEQFAICDMRLVTRSVDPYIQYDDFDEPRGNHPDYWIAAKHRVRMCKPCYRERYQQDDDTQNDQGETRGPKA